MEIRSSVLECIGNTPLVRLAAASAETGCEILGKAEFMNPGGSIKDRAALGIVRAAEASGELRPGGTIVEGTAGNTGIGIAMVANALGYRTVIVMPDTQSKEKIDTLRAYGADLHLVPAVPYRNPENYVHVSQRLADQLATTDPAGAVWANQFDNTANRDFHAVTTGPEIWNQTEGKVDGFVCAVGTGGTLAGVASALRTRNPGVSIALSDPAGSGLYHYYANGEIRVEGNSITEGIGNGRITGNLQDVAIDHAFRIEDSESIPIVFRLLREEGLLLGGSSGVNVAGAIRLARELGPGHVIVTILCDSGLRYRGKLFNRDFLVSKGLDAPDWL
ncbi:MAG: cysteine synthase A [Chromatiales bacterium]|jgi:cysteine synthase A|nr:cysteine synthase A [Chromatiales bacterium]MDH3932088.1 cysteine synthase A [Chromatiales bacterium]MDH3946924.1 cysteine synthase A [Chromatiales bacterium]MDH4012928.1 cysteine synthase A [Chromatiales bacterium]PLX57761.1 MAG: cysteine synthase A [Chromatiales bacterium]